MQDSIGPYRIEGELGRGGMGVVYKGHDTSLDRTVAVKALPDDLAADASRLERFEREARTLAQLNHPNVAGIHGIETHDERRYLILEFVDGETLADRLDRGPIAPDEAVELAQQIARGVAAAHDAGVIHRDLKPANIKITPEGVAKVLDFGLAKPTEEAASTSGVSALPTLTTPAMNSPTMAGAILGTAAYMSPEQARGRRVDKRTDVWSFGVVLYEMLTGIGPFRGETVTDSIGAILHRDVDLARLPEGTPRSAHAVIARCLQRDKELRYRDIGDAGLDLGAGDDARAPADSGSMGLGLILAAAPLVLIAGAAAGWFGSRATAPAAEPSAPVSLSIPLPDGLEVYGPIAISPDGTTIAFTAEDRFGSGQLYLRGLDSFEFVEVSGGSDGFCPFFSPDGNNIGFAARGSIRRAAVAGGPSTRLADAGWLAGASWGPDNEIVYSTGLNSPLRRMTGEGRQLDPVTTLDAPEAGYAHVWPQHIPGSETMLFTIWSSRVAGQGEGNVGGAAKIDRTTGAYGPLVERDGFTPPARWAGSGHVLFEAFDAGLIALPFDPEDPSPLPFAEATPVLEHVDHLGNSTRSVFALSDNGVMAFVPGGAEKRQLVWIDADGSTEPVFDEAVIVSYARITGNVSLNPSGTVALVGGGGDIVVIDLARKLPRRLTFDSGNDLHPIWAPSGDRVLFLSNRDTRWSLWSVGTGADTTAELVYQANENIASPSIATDGTIAFSLGTPDGTDDIWLLAPNGATAREGEGREATPLVRSRFDENNPAISPDGTMVAYQSDASGADEIYLVPTTPGAAPVQVSSAGGTSPKWSPDGLSLYFRRGRSIAMVAIESGRPVGSPQPVFPAENLVKGRSFDLSPDGTRMLAVQTDDDAIADEIRVITNFFDVIREAAGE